MEALLSLEWQASCEWIAKKREDEQLLEAVDVDQVESSSTTSSTMNKEERKEAFNREFSHVI